MVYESSILDWSTAVWGFFLCNGINHLQETNEMDAVSWSEGSTGGELAVKLSAAPLIVGRTSILLGVKAKLGASAILGFFGGNLAGDA